MSGLIHHSDDGGYEKCVICGGQAVGPCARCDGPVCGDCCVLTEGTTKPYAICLGCNESRGGASMGGGWLTVIGWFLLPIVLLACAVYVLYRIAGP